MAISARARAHWVNYASPVSISGEAVTTSPTGATARFGGHSDTGRGQQGVVGWPIRDARLTALGDGPPDAQVSAAKRAMATFRRFNEALRSGRQ